jgi:hypothetical protein
VAAEGRAHSYVASKAGLVMDHAGLAAGLATFSPTERATMLANLRPCDREKVLEQEKTLLQPMKILPKRWRPVTLPRDPATFAQDSKDAAVAAQTTAPMSQPRRESKETPSKEDVAEALLLKQLHDPYPYPPLAMPSQQVCFPRRSISSWDWRCIGLGTNKRSTGIALANASTQNSSESLTVTRPQPQQAVEEWKRAVGSEAAQNCLDAAAVGLDVLLEGRPARTLILRTTLHTPIWSLHLLFRLFVPRIRK